VGNLVLPAVRQELRYNMADLEQSPQYVTAYQAATEGLYSNARYEYLEGMLLQYKGKNPFMIYADWSELPLQLTEVEKDNHLSNKYPNQFATFYLKCQSEDRAGSEVLTPSGIEILTPAGFESLEVCHYPIYQTVYNSTRLAFQAVKEVMQCTSLLQAWNIIRRELEGADLVKAYPGCGNKETLVKRFEETLYVIKGKIVSHLTQFFSCLIQVCLKAECINSTFWFSPFLVWVILWLNHRKETNQPKREKRT
jgi:hypothetical protein